MQVQMQTHIHVHTYTLSMCLYIVCALGDREIRLAAPTGWHDLHPTPRLETLFRTVRLLLWFLVFFFKGSGCTLSRNTGEDAQAQMALHCTISVADWFKPSSAMCICLFGLVDSLPSGVSTPGHSSGRAIRFCQTLALVVQSIGVTMIAILILTLFVLARPRLVGRCMRPSFASVLGAILVRRPSACGCAVSSSRGLGTEPSSAGATRARVGRASGRRSTGGTRLARRTPASAWASSALCISLCATAASSQRPNMHGYFPLQTCAYGDCLRLGASGGSSLTLAVM